MRRVTPAAIGQLKTAINLIRQAMLLLDAVMQEMREDGIDQPG